MSSHGSNLAYGIYGATDSDSANRKLQQMNKSHQQVTSTTGQMDGTRPLEEMPYQVMDSQIRFVLNEGCLRINWK